MNEHSGLSQVMRFFLKDVRIIRRFLMLAVLAYLVYAAIFYALTPYYYLATMLFALFFAVGVTIVDDYHKSDGLFCSLPIPRNIIVIGRYFSSIMMLVLGICLCFGYAFLLDSLMGSELAVYPPGIMALGVLPFSAASLLFLSLFYPFYFRFGIAKGTVIFLSGLIITGLLFFGIKALLSMLGSALQWPSNPWAALIAGFSALRSVLSAGSMIAATIALIAVFVGISVMLSIRFYRMREF